MFDYRDNEKIAAAGYRVEHDAAAQIFRLYEAEKQVGAAHYTLRGAVLDFDNTVVDPALRGTGLSQFLAHQAVTHEITAGKQITASCWFIAKFLARNPELHTTPEAI